MLCIQGKERSVCQKHEGKVLGGGLSLKDRRKEEGRHSGSMTWAGYSPGSGPGRGVPAGAEGLRAGQGIPTSLDPRGRKETAPPAGVPLEGRIVEGRAQIGGLPGILRPEAKPCEGAGPAVVRFVFLHRLERAKQCAVGGGCGCSVPPDPLLSSRLQVSSGCWRCTWCSVMEPLSSATW